MRRLGLIEFAAVFLYVVALFIAACGARKSAGNSAVNSPAAKDWRITANWKYADELAQQNVSLVVPSGLSVSWQ
jgi:hypothetical protein